jgi:predicted metal-dependent hydrolase
VFLTESEKKEDVILKEKISKKRKQRNETRSFLSQSMLERISERMRKISKQNAISKDKRKIKYKFPHGIIILKETLGRSSGSLRIKGIR